MIAALLADDAVMQAGDVPPPDSSPLDWIGKITSDAFWQRLVDLRSQSLRLELPNVAGLITGTMARIDGLRLAEVVRQQVPRAPAAWRDVQLLRATEYEQEARQRQGQATPFQRIIQRLRIATSLALFKVWCEGVTDGPTIKELISKLPGAQGSAIVTDSLGGWGNILSPSWRADRLRDGCHDLIVLLDGDKGRDLNAPARPLNASGIRVRGLLQRAGIELCVLERYGIENYFSQAACVAVLGPSAGVAFPLPHQVAPALPHHNKNLNPEIAHNMTPNDLAGTDLLRILEEVVRRSQL